jgi:hypothetical protein
MRKMLLALLAAGSMAAISTAATTTPAEAWGGCGPFRHPTPWGCRLNVGYYGGPAFVGGYGYGWHRPWGYYHRPWGWHRHYW